MSSAGDRAFAVDIRRADAESVDHYKRADGVRWWLELGDELIVAGDTDAVARLARNASGARDLGEMQPEDLVLHARGCGDTSPPAELWVAATESFDLLRRPVDAAHRRALSAAHPEHLGTAEWVPVSPNQVIARQYRLDHPRADPPDPMVQPLVDAVDAARWFQTVSQLASWDRSSYSEQLAQARGWIGQQFQALGLVVAEPAFSFVYNGNTANVNNIVGRLDGTRLPDEWVVVGAHYDSRNETNGAPLTTPGADDNASGCAGVIEAARVLTRFRPERTVVFACFAGEEQGLHGSKAHVAELTQSGNLGKVVAMLNMDMIGWSPDANLGVSLGSTNAPLTQRLAAAAATYVPSLAVTTTTNTCCSDHMPYLNAGRPAVLSIHRGGTSYPSYHRKTDTPSNLGAYASQVGGAIVTMNVAALAGLSGASDRVFADAFDTP
ncbi:M28 family metallopeptidase [Tahibacter amnicola]|uniref:M28 family metallopeptidase n=1 Tax=Tahibacter amnicola TaxID=2976241 RepID=A0ABY6BKI2_9GAMM|nr:M28 family metallopeptidase [Tahibacter amnicola]UXI69982.1 M28 family metallopeptidase [Tahibacter amnicola]